ncbi:trimeric intracellular cation channel family protein [Pseudoclavibacter sp. CFCC 13796]|uniref:trimeric intracellular cation channel family protein n=1 Tax=Pseudoclavibacter sp. CFCC 13796 TaxID=2615179 RepID=UPI0013012A40|nr:trimeric intracellular cation channel family protein [Pseudoclavibacter sp. CFCC 13796]KAB1661265.1 trimeric intracellular cation channel family protein [Pseudoclavibacter sp. CFCC 13796]
MDADAIIRIVYLIGISSFAVSGVLAAARAHLDFFGALLVGLLCAVGGGTLRETLLGNTPVYWMHDPVILATVLSVAIAAFVLVRFVVIPRWLLELTDIAGLAIVSVIGAKAAIAADATPLAVFILAVLTGVTGEIIRDLLVAQSPPTLLVREIYAAASFAGAVMYWVLHVAGIGDLTATVVAVLTIATIRVLAIWRGWHLPKARLRVQPNSGIADEL